MTKRTAKQWQYEEVRDIVLSERKTSTHELCEKYNRTKGSIGAVFEMWRLFLKDPSYQYRCPSDRMYAFFKRIQKETSQTNGNGVATSNTIVSEVPYDIDYAVIQLEKSIEILKKSIEMVIQTGVNERMNKELKTVRDELVTLREFKQKVQKANWAETIKSKMFG